MQGVFACGYCRERETDPANAVTHDLRPVFIRVVGQRVDNLELTIVERHSQSAGLTLGVAAACARTTLSTSVNEANMIKHTPAERISFTAKDLDKCIQEFLLGTCPKIRVQRTPTYTTRKIGGGQVQRLADGTVT
jgi:hypothetical protein